MQLTPGTPYIALLLVGLAWPGAAAGQAADVDDDAEAAVPTCVDHYQAKRYRDARSCFTKLLDSAKPDPDLLYAIAFSSYQLGDHEAAISGFEQLLTGRSDDGDAIFMLAMSHAHAGHHVVALRGLRAALAAGLTNEDPAEARRHISHLERLLDKRTRAGWQVSASASAGYDSYPMPSGAAAAATTNLGADVSASGFARLELGARYAWPRFAARSGELRALTSARYSLRQYLLFSDFSSGDGRGQGVLAESLTDLSLQTHGARLSTRHALGDWTLGAETGADVDLAGAAAFTALLAAATTTADASYEWSSQHSNQVTVGWTPQWALADDLDHLAGHGGFAELGYELRPHPRFKLALSYQLTMWWLGRLELMASDCVAGQTCARDIPYSHHLHRPALTARLTLGAVDISAGFALESRRYWDEGRYITRDGDDLRERRIDLAELARLGLRARLSKTTALTVTARYIHNVSTIDEDSVGVDEGYDRFEASLGLSYRH